MKLLYVFALVVKAANILNLVRHDTLIDSDWFLSLPEVSGWRWLYYSVTIFDKKYPKGFKGAATATRRPKNVRNKDAQKSNISCIKYGKLDNDAY